MWKTEFGPSKSKTYTYLIEDHDGKKKAKRTNYCIIKQRLECENCKHCLEATQPKKKINQPEKNKIKS